MWIEKLNSVTVKPKTQLYYKYKGLIDIIIPVYNDRAGLYKTLFSFNIMNKYHIIIVDDCSTDNYDDIIQFFNQFFEITYVKTPNNGGPAVAKNYGKIQSTNKYITFIDAGDTWANSMTLIQMEKILEQNPEYQYISAAYYEEGTDASLKYIGPRHNTWRGKVYKRRFMDNFDLHFLESSSFSNDDIGMNILADLVCEPNEIAYVDEPALIWQIDVNSITRKNNNQYFYSVSPMGTVQAALYALKTAEQYYVPEVRLQETACDIMCDLYYQYLAVLNYKPEYIDSTFAACKLFYDEYFSTMSIDLQMLTDIYHHHTLGKFSNKDFEPSVEKISCYPFGLFLDELNKN